MALGLETNQEGGSSRCSSPLPLSSECSFLPRGHKLSDVVFDVQKVYSIEDDIFIRMSLHSPTIKLSSEDRIVLCKFNEAMDNILVASLTVVEQKFYVVFKSIDLKILSNIEFNSDYQVKYLRGGKIVAGASIPFRIVKHKITLNNQSPLINDDVDDDDYELIERTPNEEINERFEEVLLTKGQLEYTLKSEIQKVNNLKIENHELKSELENLKKLVASSVSSGQQSEVNSTLKNDVGSHEDINIDKSEDTIITGKESLFSETQSVAIAALNNDASESARHSIISMESYVQSDSHPLALQLAASNEELSVLSCGGNDKVGETEGTGNKPHSISKLLLYINKIKENNQFFINKLGESNNRILILEKNLKPLIESGNNVVGMGGDFNASSFHESIAVCSEIKRLKEDMLELKDGMENNETIIENVAKTEVLALNEEASRLNAEINKLKTEKNSLVISNINIEYLTSENKKLIDDCDIATATLKKLEDIHQDLDKKLEDKDAQIHTLYTEVERLRRKVDRLRQTHDRTIEKHNEELRCIQETREQELNVLRGDLKHKDNLVARLTEESVQFSCHKIESNKKAKEFEKRLENAKNEYKTLYRQNNKLQMRLMECLNKNKEKAPRKSSCDQSVQSEINVSSSDSVPTETSEPTTPSSEPVVQTEPKGATANIDPEVTSERCTICKELIFQIIGEEGYDPMTAHLEAAHEVLVCPVCKHAYERNLYAFFKMHVDSHFGAENDADDSVGDDFNFV